LRPEVQTPALKKEGRKEEKMCDYSKNRGAKRQGKRVI
jgi:hypothetical protein